MGDINDELRRARARSLHPCGNTITVTGDDFTDEEGHSVAYVHAEPARRHAASVQAVARLHQPDREGIVPMCPECGKAAPCPTLRAVTEEA
ncbi:hypothetical protein [Nocardia farcinica]|uniref:hypothetical protein n=1 Tax=Nocardia farcinica TaxID=37329 RepID=UPI0024558469|nr:hypothetical protein [Nocardia farcinica]